MAIVKLVLQIILVIFSLLLTLLILMHKGKGGGLSDMFGGGLTQNAGSSGVAEKNLNRWTVIIALLLPSAAPLVGCLMLGNLMKECGVVDRLSKTVQNELMNIVVIFLGLTVGATAPADQLLNPRTLFILVLGVIAFAMGTAGGVLLAKVMNFFSKGDNKINPLIGSAGVSAVPMAARVSQTEGQKADPSNFLLMHAMGPNVAGVVGSAVAAGILLSFLG